jgi:transcription elongation GreA/GreB family factor
MEATLTFADAESNFVTLLDSKPLKVNDLLALIHSVPVKNNGKNEEWAAILAQELIDNSDFDGLYLLFKGCTGQFLNTLGIDGIVNDLKRVCKERLNLAFIDSIEFKSQPLEKSFRELDTLLALAPGVQVIDKTWGFGVVRKLDNFYKRVTLDFNDRSGHNLTFKTAAETLTIAPPDHLLTIQANHPEELKRLIREEPAALVMLTIRSFGRMPVAKLETTLIEKQLLAASDWKSFWDNARKALKKDPLITVPARRNECIEILDQAAAYDEKWFEQFEEEKEPRSILSSLTELRSLKKLDTLDDKQAVIVNDRLSFAIRGADNSDAALYAQLVTFAHKNNIKPEFANSASNGRVLYDPLSHLWENRRFIRAAENLSVRDVAAMVEFLLSEGNSAVEKLLNALELMPYNLLSETLLTLREDPRTAETCRRILRSPKAPPPLINWIFRYRNELVDWKLPPLMELLHHAIAVVESNLTGEDLRMQNSLKKLFASAKWLKAIFGELSETHRQLLFERIQASPAWDPSNHRTLLARMIKLDATLADRKRAVQEADTAPEHLTSWRSLTERQMQYKKLIEVDMPKNSKDIATARSYGDLRENFEYQAAKDYQRQLLQRQAEIQFELEIIRGTDFAGVTTAEVAPGTTVEMLLEKGTLQSYTILGEWDRDEDLNIISNKSAMAISLIGKKVGDVTMIPIPGGTTKAEIKSIKPLSAEIRTWIAATPPTTNGAHS